MTRRQLSHLNPKVQALRGLAVLAVISFHFAESVIPNGWLGVDVFFVISGFVVTKQLLRIRDDNLMIRDKQINGYLSFVIRRLFRLAPALGVVITVSTLLMIITIPANSMSKFITQAFLSIFGLGNIGAIKNVGNYFDSTPNPFTHTWSLGVEEQIYLILGALFFLQSSNPKKFNVFKKNTSILNLICSLSFISFISLEIIYKNLNQSIELFNFYFMSQRIWEFCLGGIAYLSKPIYQSILSKTLSTSAQIALILILFSKSVNIEKYQLIIVVNILTVLILKIGTLLNGNKVLNLLVYFGNTSYSSYLIHMPLFYIARYSPLLSDGRNTKIIRVVMFFLTFILSHFLNKYIESKLRIESKTKGIGIKRIILVLSLGVFGPTLLLGSTSYIYSHSHNIKSVNPQKPADPSESLETCKTDRFFNYCSNSNNASHDTSKAILMIGDSHARHFSKTFIKLSEDNSTAGFILTKSGCQFILPEFVRDTTFRKLYEAYSKVNVGDKESCFEHNDKILRYVSQNPKLIILAVYRSSSMVQADFGYDPKMYIPILVKSLSKLISSSQRLYILGPNPEFSDGNRFFAGNTLFWQKKYESDEKQKMNRDQMLPNPFSDFEIIRESIRKSNISIINGVTPFCNATQCFRKKDGEWLYSNSDHLSLNGTDLLKDNVKFIFENS